MNETERRDRLVQWLEIIVDGVQDLLGDDHIFWKLQKMVRGPVGDQRTPSWDAGISPTDARELRN